MTVTVPTVHLNGTSFTELRDSYHRAYDAVQDAKELFANATCNARDFYPQGPDAYSAARRERDEAFAQLDAAQRYIEAVLIGICDQERG